MDLTDSGVTWTAHAENAGWIGSLCRRTGRSWSRRRGVTASGPYVDGLWRDLDGAREQRLERRPWHRRLGPCCLVGGRDEAGRASLINQLYTSTDSGVTWTPARAAGIGLRSPRRRTGRSWFGLVRLLYTSTNSGVTWTVRGQRGRIEVASSAVWDQAGRSGDKRPSVVHFDRLWRDLDSGATIQTWNRWPVDGVTKLWSRQYAVASYTRQLSPQGLSCRL